MKEQEPWTSVVGNAIGCLAIAALAGIVLLVWFSTSGTSVQFR